MVLPNFAVQMYKYCNIFSLIINISREMKTKTGRCVSSAKKSQLAI